MLGREQWGARFREVAGGSLAPVLAVVGGWGRLLGPEVVGGAIT